MGNEEMGNGKKRGNEEMNWKWSSKCWRASSSRQVLLRLTCLLPLFILAAKMIDACGI